jgi:hypothetical protein
MFVVTGPNVASETPDQDDGKKDSTNEHVAGMQADERVEGRPKQVGADREPILVNQLDPLGNRPNQESNPAGERDKPPEMKSSQRTLFQKVFGSHDRPATAKQQNGTQPGEFQDLVGIRGCEAFSDIKKIRDHEDDEER